MMENKKRAFSGIQPTGCLTLGNYVGAVKSWLNMQEEFDCIFSVVDMHSITVRQDPAALRKRCMEFFCEYIACGLDPEKSILFFQSHVSQHAELAWILNCFTYMGELSRMTQFKEKSARHADNINAGLFTYPVLMAADILLYGAEIVPVGHDQKQHVELTRDIAERFNGVYGDVFVVPEPYIPPVGARIKSLQEPEKKMSKSDPNPNGYIWVLDEPDVIMKKIKRAVTDSDGEIAYREGKDGINNLLAIYGAMTDKTPQDAAKEFEGLGYGVFKERVGEAVAETLAPIRDKYNDLLKNKDYVESVYKNGAQKASAIAYKTLRKVHKKLGFIQR
ncbi:MAG: tryptophan--tRNA ligase [Clostridia bacterium]|nr:tryptophan--tRNA ligase [Clostridia bacterium]